MREPLQPRESVRQMSVYSRPLSGRATALRLDFNENTQGCSPKVIQALRAATTESVATYPEYDAVTSRLAKHFGVHENQMMLTNGADEAIQIVIHAFLESGDGIIILDPSYAMYRIYAELFEARIRMVSYDAITLAFPIKTLLSAISTETKMILISNPNNPTGTGAKCDEIAQVLEKAPHAAVLVDEAYFEFCGTTVLPLINDFPNLLVCRSFSKAYGLAAVRFACLFSDARNLVFARKVQGPYSVNGLGAVAASAAVDDQMFVAAYVSEVQAARELLYVELERLGIPYYRSDANFVLVRLGERASEICAQLRLAGILVRDRTHEVPGCVRITVGTRKQITELIKRLVQLRS